jgi:hypothetical protein
VWDAVLTTSTTLVCVGLAGYAYSRYYKSLTLKKIEHAFRPGDPALELYPRLVRGQGGDVDHSNEESHWVIR